MNKIHHNVSLDSLMPVMKEQLLAGQSVKFSPRGISMLPMLRQGKDSIILSTLPDKLKKYDIPLYQRDNGKYVLHRVVEVGDTYTCIGDNQYTFEYGLRHDQMIGVVTAFTRGDKEHSVKEPGYQLYCRVWHYSRPMRYFFFRVKRKLRKLVKLVIH